MYKYCNPVLSDLIRENGVIELKNRLKMDVFEEMLIFLKNNHRTGRGRS